MRGREEGWFGCGRERNLGVGEVRGKGAFGVREWTPEDSNLCAYMVWHTVPR